VAPAHAAFAGKNSFLTAVPMAEMEELVAPSMWLVTGINGLYLTFNSNHSGKLVGEEMAKDEEKMEKVERI
jgi:hypothetical protein